MLKNCVNIVAVVDTASKKTAIVIHLMNLQHADCANRIREYCDPNNKRGSEVVNDSLMRFSLNKTAIMK